MFLLRLLSIVSIVLLVIHLSDALRGNKYNQRYSNDEQTSYNRQGRNSNARPGQERIQRLSDEKFDEPKNYRDNDNRFNTLGSRRPANQQTLDPNARSMQSMQMKSAMQNYHGVPYANPYANAFADQSRMGFQSNNFINTLSNRMQQMNSMPQMNPMNQFGVNPMGMFPTPPAMPKGSFFKIDKDKEETTKSKPKVEEKKPYSNSRYEKEDLSNDRDDLKWSRSRPSFSDDSERDNEPRRGGQNQNMRRERNGQRGSRRDQTADNTKELRRDRLDEQPRDDHSADRNHRNRFFDDDSENVKNVEKTFQERLNEEWSQNHEEEKIPIVEDKKNDSPLAGRRFNIENLKKEDKSLEGKKVDDSNKPRVRVNHESSDDLKSVQDEEKKKDFNRKNRDEPNEQTDSNKPRSFINGVRNSGERQLRKFPLNRNSDHSDSKRNIKLIRKLKGKQSISTDENDEILRTLKMKVSPNTAITFGGTITNQNTNLVDLKIAELRDALKKVEIIEKELADAYKTLEQKNETNSTIILANSKKGSNVAQLLTNADKVHKAATIVIEHASPTFQPADQLNQTKVTQVADGNNEEKLEQLAAVLKQDLIEKTNDKLDVLHLL